MKKFLAVIAAFSLVGILNAQSPWELALQKTVTNGGIAGAARYTTTLAPTCNTANTGGIIWNTTTGTEQVCNGSAWASVVSGTATLVIGATVSGGGANRVLFEDGSQLLAANAGFTYVATNNVLTLGTTTTAGTATLISDSALGGASATDNLLNITGTFPASLSASTPAVLLSFTGNGSSNQQNSILKAIFSAGYTGVNTNVAIYGTNATAGSPDFINAGTIVAGVIGETTGVSTVSAGVLGQSTGASTNSYGVIGHTIAGTHRAGVIGNSNSSGATTYIGGLFTLAGSLGASSFSGASSGLLVSNGADAFSIARFYDNTTLKGAFLDGGNFQLTNNQLTAGTAAVENAGIVNAGVSSYTWTNAQVVTALAGAGDILMATLPAKTVVKNAYVIITGQAATSTTLTVACGRTSATYIDYIVASDAKAAANTVYGDASAERGTNLTGYDLPSYTATTAVNCHFVKTGSDPTASTGRLILETSLVP